MTLKLDPKSQNLARKTLAGDYDTDNGGKQPGVRAERRRDLETLLSIANWERQEWDLLPMHDLLVLQRVTARIADSVSEMAVIREQQNGSGTFTGGAK